MNITQYDHIIKTNFSAVGTVDGKCPTEFFSEKLLFTMMSGTVLGWVVVLVEIVVLVSEVNDAVVGLVGP